MTLPSEDADPGEEVGIVDVPGHRDFIENMLAGIGGIDAALFVIAADEGVMPQTREHLAILDLLQIPTGVIALTKTDMVYEKDLGGDDWLELVESDIHSVLQNTVLENAAIVRTSGKTGDGIPQLKTAMWECLQNLPPKADLNRPRLPIDRVFSIAGFGTVLTGTLSDGQLRSGDEVEILPTGIKSRIRGLQTHKQQEEAALPGGRTAVNISGVAVDQIQRGDVLIHPDTYFPSCRLDLELRLLPDASASIKHNSEVKFFTGASEVIARIRLLGKEEIKPGEGGWVQVELRKPIVTVRGDRFIIRRPSPGETLGGGMVVDPFPAGRHKRFADDNLRRLKALSGGTPEDILFQTIQTAGVVEFQDLGDKAGLEQEIINEVLPSLLESGSVIALPTAKEPTRESMLVSKALWEQLSTDTIRDIGIYHKEYPLKQGISREQIKSQRGTFNRYPARFFGLFMDKLAAEGKLAENGFLIHLPDHRIHFSEDQEADIQRLILKFETNPNSPPSVKESQAEVGEDVYAALVELGELVQVSPEVVFRSEDYQRLVSDVKSYIENNGTITVAQARDRYQTSRKYVLALLEHLDAIGVTVREGDIRRIK
jgi:selenocysteine-specific elongation factor